MKLSIITPENKIYEDVIKRFIFTAIDGEIEIQDKHCDLITVIDNCQATIFQEHSKKEINLSGGLCKVKNNELYILTTKAEFLNNIKANS